MKQLIGAMLVGVVTSVGALPASWKLSEVRSYNNVPAGYIYYTESIGTQKTPDAKVVTGLRLVCSMDPVQSPIISVFWNTLTGSAPVGAMVSIDRKPISFGSPILWDRAGPLLIRSSRVSTELLQAMKTGKYFKITWQTSGTIRETIFDLSQFQQGLSEFNRVCKSKL
jgi:hypothetical protein